MNEPTIEDTIKILKGLKTYYEDFHKLKYTDDAIKTAVELSARYITDRKLPDKAIDVIDEAGASQMLLPENKRRKKIGAKDIEAVIAKMARVPAKSVSKSDTESLRSLESDLKRAVYGQDDAINQLAAAMKMSRAGLRDTQKPIGSYLFPALRASARLRWPASWRRPWALSSCVSTCRNIWNGTRSHGSSAPLQAT